MRVWVLVHTAQYARWGFGDERNVLCDGSPLGTLRFVRVNPATQGLTQAGRAAAVCENGYPVSWVEVELNPTPPLRRERPMAPVGLRGIELED